MLLALVWWAILLHNKTNTIYDLKSQRTEIYPEAKSELVRQRTMIASETLVFVAAMILGIYFINRAYRREMVAMKQQKNFLLSVTHELKSPITAIQLILETFQRRQLNESQIASLIKDGKDETIRLNKLVEDLLTAARLSPKKTLRRENIDLLETVELLINQYQKNYPDFNFSLEKQDAGYIVNTNQSSIYLIVSNLLDNAVKYTQGSPNIKITLDKKANHVSLKVIDNGIGIPEEEKNKIFDQFYRIGDEDIRTTKGTGLGLYLVKELCIKLGISIEVKDNSPSGSIFALSIPTKK